MTLEPISDLSKAMAMKIAASGLNMQHLQAGYKRGGLKNVLSEDAGDGCRVTKSKKVVEKLDGWFRTNLE